MAQPMQGVKVVDLSRILAGPLCTMTLGDFGAEVLKVESRAGDETRRWLPPVTSDGVSTYYSAVNRNKQAIVVDFKNPEELHELCKIIDDADVLVQNFGFYSKSTECLDQAVIFGFIAIHRLHQHF
jgi:crotonobetainyl-CoA:carnitine CoA-transferase CaiB-like acyl-CoA transferase